MNQQFEGQTHVDYGELADYVEGRIAGTDLARVQEHLEQCGSCRSFVDWMQDIAELIKSDDWQDAPVLLQESVRARFADHQRRAQPRLSFGEWLSGLFVPPRRVAFGIAILLVIILFGAILLLTPGGGAGPSTAEIIAMRESAEILPRGTAEWQTLEQSRRIEQGDAVRTDSEGLLLIAFPDNSHAQLEPETTLKIEELAQVGQERGQSITLVQEMGQTRYQVNSPREEGAHFRIHTASADIEVTGTEFTVNVDREGMTMVAVAEGVVHITAGAKTLVIGSGLGATVRPGEEPGEVVSVDVEEWRIRPFDDSGQFVLRTPTATAMPAGQESEGAASATAQATASTSTPTRTPTRTPTTAVTATNTPTATPTVLMPTATPTPTVPAPTQPPPEDDDGPTPTKKFPPGLTKTPEPPGQTKTPKPPGNNSGGNDKD